MSLEKYKVCPNCGEHNAPQLLECRKCETDLTGVKVVDSSSESEITSVPASFLKKTLYRICECGNRNPSQARKCQSCGEDISDIIPTADSAEPGHLSVKFEAVEDDCSATFDSDTIIGRESEMSDYLHNKTFVSRQQAKIIFSDNKVMIENLSQTNKTFVNNEQICDEQPFELHDGDEIGLGGKSISGSRQPNAAYFYVRIIK